LDNTPFNDDNEMQNVTGSIVKSGLKGTAQAGKRAGKYAAKTFLKVVKYIFAMLLPYLIPIIIVLLMFFIIYSYIFLLPRFTTDMMKRSTSSTQFTSIYGYSKFGNGWGMADDKSLYDEYIKLCNSWSDGLDDYQKQQAEKYKVSWALLAAIDRISGEQTVSNKWGRNPKPKENYDALKPIFEWEKYTEENVCTYEYLKEVYERDEQGKIVLDENGKAVVAEEIWVDREDDEPKEVKLLKTADNFDNLFEYEYEEYFIDITQDYFVVTNSAGDTIYKKYSWEKKTVPDEYKEYERIMKNSKDTERRRNYHTYMTKKEVINVTSGRMPLERLYNLLLSYGIDSEIEVGSVVYLAETYDDEFYLNDFVTSDGLYEYGMYAPSARNIWNTLPEIDTENLTRQDVVDIAKSLLTCIDGGPLPYFWGGKYPKKGVNPNWGTTARITAAGNKRWRVGSMLPLGLDCSGFVDWVYVQATGKSISAMAGGGGAAAQYYACKPIKMKDLKPGDLGFLKNPYKTGGTAAHVGIYIGKDSDGTPLFIHCTANTYGVTDKFYRAGRGVIISRLTGYYKGTNPPIDFKYFGRPPVRFIND